jgi:hypothetical protein
MPVPVRGLQQVLLGQDLLCADRPVVGEQDPEPSVVSQNSVEAPATDLQAVGGLDPRGVGLGSHRLPQPPGQVIAQSTSGHGAHESRQGHGFACGVAKTYALLDLSMVEGAQCFDRSLRAAQCRELRQIIFAVI